MPAERNPRGKYKYSEETLNELHSCKYCSKQFKIQGLRRHEDSCRKRIENEQQEAACNIELEISQLRRRRAHSALGDDDSVIQPGPSQLHGVDARDDARIASVLDDNTHPPDDVDFADVCQDDLPAHSPGPSNVSMGSNRMSASPVASSQAGPPEFKTEYHPRSSRPPQFHTYDEFGVNGGGEPVPLSDDQPWRPFKSRGDFEFAEIALEAGLNEHHINALLKLFSSVSDGSTQVTMKSQSDLHQAWDTAAQRLTPFSQCEINAPYQKEVRTFDVYVRPLWDWALDLLHNPLLAPHFVWDAQQVYHHNGIKYERFYSEPWTGDRWWDIQSHLPNVPNAVPFAFILYADKTKLSSHGTVKGYPVIAHCANLPVHIRNSDRIGGGCVVGWLPIVPEAASDEGKTSYANFKRVVWHEAFLKFLEMVIELSKTGYAHECYDAILRWLFPLILILSADYEEQCVMALLRGVNSKRPCLICLVPLEELHDLTKNHPLRTVEQGRLALEAWEAKKSVGEERLKALGLRPVQNVFWRVENSDPHDALSVDKLHLGDHGLFGKHMLRDLKTILKALGRGIQTCVEENVSLFPRWQSLHHFDTFIHITFTDGNKMRDLAREVFYACLNVMTHTKTREGYRLLHMIRSYLDLESLFDLDLHTETMLDMFSQELVIWSAKLEAYIACVKESAIEDLKENWDFPKAHLWKHVVRDIQRKGVSRNYSTRPNEGMHKPLKDAYCDHTNNKDVANQLLRVDHYKLALKFLRARIDVVDEQLADTGLDDHPNDLPATSCGNVKLGSACQHQEIGDLEKEHSPKDSAFRGFRQKFTDFINTNLPSYGYNLTNWMNIPSNFLIQEYRYLRVRYESAVDWNEKVDHLRCNPVFHGKPRYDCALIHLTESETAFVRLIYIFSCKIKLDGDDQTFQFALVQPYTAGLGARRRIDEDLKLICVKATARSSPIFIPVISILRGAVLYPDPANRDEFFVVRHLDGDMFLQMIGWNSRNRSQVIKFSTAIVVLY